MSVSALVLVRVAGPASLQDLGRPGQLHLGLPRGGTLAPTTLAALNADLGNPADAPGLEVFGLLVARAEGAVVARLDGGETVALADGETLTVRPSGQRLRLVAVAGGFDAPLVLGGRGLLPSAGVGGLTGRFLVTGDRLPIAPAPGGAPREARGGPRALLGAHAEAPVRLLRGPHTSLLREPEALVRAPWTLGARSDRTGLVLEGPALATWPRDAEADSLPMVPGAIQLPPDGRPIVLGADHPVSGGYPVVAVVAHDDLEALFTRPLGASVSFTLDAP
jgi:5-oxoprolinase (ATP-hydrolysing) subunit C